MGNVSKRQHPDQEVENTAKGHQGSSKLVSFLAFSVLFLELRLSFDTFPDFSDDITRSSKPEK